ncbi:MAG: hypothetical protein AAGA81_04830 [Acidobacteriota bacterium]
MTDTATKPVPTWMLLLFVAALAANVPYFELPLIPRVGLVLFAVALLATGLRKPKA